jgi:hypothetical protein
MTYALRGARSDASHALAAPIARAIALIALAALGLPGDPVHEAVHAREPPGSHPVTARYFTEGYPRPRADRASWGDCYRLPARVYRHRKLPMSMITTTLLQAPSPQDSLACPADVVRKEHLGSALAARLSSRSQLTIVSSGR